MVARKTSLPYPTSPSSPTSQRNPVIPGPNNLMVDSTEVPPVPQMKHSNHTPAHESLSLEHDNPWSDQASPRLRTDRPVPDFLKIRNGRPVEQEQRQQSLRNVPNALRPVDSGQDTPRSSSDSEESRGFWEDDEVDEEESGRSSPRKEEQLTAKRTAQQDTQTRAPVSSPPGIIKRKPLNLAGQPLSPQASQSNDFASNNPFRRVSNDAVPLVARSPRQDSDLPQWGSQDQDHQVKGKQPVRDFALKPSIEDFSRVTVQADPTAYDKVQGDMPSEDPWKQFETKFVPLQPQSPPPPPPQQPQRAPPAPPIPQTQVTSPPDQPPLIPASSSNDNEHLPNPWTSDADFAPVSQPQSTMPFDPSQKHVSHYDDSGSIPQQHELKAVPKAPGVQPPVSQQSLLDDNEDVGPPLPQRRNQTNSMHETERYAPPEGRPPSKPPRPGVATKRLSEAEIAKNREDRNETYQIKHFNWFDHSSGRLRQSSMLTQNQNGPCPLLALVNALILGAKDESQAALDDALRSREQVSLGLIIETLMYELVTRSADSGEQLPDVDELNAFLMRLRSGMNANPKFVTTKKPPPNIMDARNSMLHLPQPERAGRMAGTFESTLDMKLYGAFSVPLLHGWLPEPQSDAAASFSRSAPTYEDAQALQFGEEELEYKLARQGLTPEEQRVWEDINSIKNFLKLYPTQLTSYGLESVQQSLSSGSFAIMFRNDHFSTIYKHPQSGQIFTLITDAGYADRDEIIWESLVDVNGSRNEFFSGDFMPVSHDDSANRSRSDSAQQNQQQHLSVPEITSSAAPLSPQEVQEQHDADFAMALQMQEEEEQRQRAENSRRRRSGAGANSGGATAPSGGSPANLGGSTSNPANPRGRGEIPIRLTTSNTSQSDRPENRPLIPPRNVRSRIVGVNRPADADDDDAPPSYEDAAKTQPYIPPMGSPLHPGSDAGASNTVTPMSSNLQLAGTVSNTSNASGPAPSYGGPSGGRGGRPGAGGQRRMSAYNETQYNSMPGGYWRTATAGGPGGAAPQQQQTLGVGRHSRVGSSGNDRERDCRVM